MVRENVSGAVVQLGRGSQEDRSNRDCDFLSSQFYSSVLPDIKQRQKVRFNLLIIFLIPLHCIFQLFQLLVFWVFKLLL